MIARIRRGNDFHVAWQIKRGGVAENLESVTDIKLERTIYGITTEHTLFTVSGDTVTAEIPAEVQTHNGQYKLTLSYELTDTGMSDDDRKCKVAIYAFTIVDPLGPADDLLTVDVTSDVSIGFKGDEGLSAYQVWLEQGNVGTEDDYFAYLQQPATDAAASISTLEQIVADNEALRVTAEQGRSDAEDLRELAEVAREEAEGIRDSNEIDRIEAEGIRDANETARINAESDRVDAEDLRELAEIARETAEGLRQTNTATAIQQAGTATTAANTAAGLANNAATAANTAAGLANNAATAANTAAGLANTARTELTTAVNTKLDEADGKIEEMDTTLSAYEGRMQAVETGKADHGYGSNPKTLKEVDDDLVQLAGEVSLLDAVQGAKIKDIENVLSTANLNQSAQVSVSGRKVVSLPKNAANSGMSVKLEGLTAENMIANGDFRNGAIGWDTGGRGTVSIVGGHLNVMSNGTSNNVYARNITAMPLVAGDKIYSIMEARVTNSMAISLAMQYDGSTGGALIPINNMASPTINTWYNISGIATIPSGYSGVLRLYVYAAYPTAAGGNWLSHEIKRAIMINLTKVFGAGNEPTKEQCALIFSDYFEGVKSFEPTGRVRSVDKNGLNPTALYLTAPELRSNGTVKDEIRKGANGYELVKRISDIDGTILTAPVITPISYGGVLNSAENGTVYHEPIIADAGVYDTKMDILLTDYPIATIEEIIKHENGVDTYLDAATAVIASDGLSFTHPDLASGDLVLFTYAFDKESTNGNITATFYDSNVVKIDTVTGRAYKITEVVTNGVLTRTLTEV